MNHFTLSCLGFVLRTSAKARARFFFASLAVVLSALSSARAVETNVAVLVRHAPSLNGSGNIIGSIQQLNGESATLNSGLVVTGDLLVPGTPTLVNNGGNTFGGVVAGTGSTPPSGYQVIMNGGVTLRYLRTRTTPVTLPSVSAPPTPTGTRSVTMSSAGQNPGDFSTLRNLTLQGSAGQVAVPPGTYGNFVANGGTGFILGVAGGGEPTIYNLQNLTLNGNSTMKIVGPVILTLAQGFSANAALGSSNNPAWLQLRIASGSFTLNSGSALYGFVLAPNGTVTVNGNSSLVGTSTSDRFIFNAGGSVQWFGQSSPAQQPPQATPQNITLAENSPAAITLSGTDPQSLPLTFAVVSSPAHGTLSGTPPNVSYQPATNYFGSDSFTFKANNGVTDSVPATISLTITQVFYPPVANGKSLTNLMNTALPITLTGSDPQGLTLTFSVLTQPSHGTLTGSAPSVVYHPATNYYGNDSFTFRVNNGITNSAAATISITNVPVDEPPMVEAGPDQLIVLPTNSVHLAGLVVYADFPGTVDTVLWSKISGPGAVTFSNASSTTNTATFSTSGIYQLNLYASDSFLEADDTLTVVVDAPPTVFAGANQTNTFPAASVLQGLAFDDGLPTNSALSTVWSVVSGPGTVVFGDPAQTNTTATFSAGGIYVLRLTANDGVASASSDITVTENVSPVVDAGADILTNGLQATLNGSVTDDGLPSASLSAQWIQTSGPGTITFGDAHATNTSVTASQSGTYVLELTADDGLATNSDDVTITFNAAPVVNAGPGQAVNFGTPVTLAGAWADDQLPHNTVTSLWTKTSGPGNVTFADATLTNTTVTFDQPGIYTLRLTADDGLATGSAEVEMIINEAPVADAGTNQVIALGQNATLDGLVSDDGLPSGTLTSQWTLISGPGQVVIADPFDPVTAATFSSAGTYVFRLTADDTMATNSSDVTVTVVAGNIAPVVNVGPKQLVVLPDGITLHGLVSDDGLPTGVPLSFSWTKVSGPGGVTFADSTATNTTATFSQAGDYVLRLTASDSQLSGFAELTVLVRTPAMNQAPVVSAGPDKVIGLTNLVTLGGSISDDGLPQGSSVTVTWSKVSGPGDVSFADGSVTNAQASFSALGEYVLRLTASDSALSAFADVHVTVYPHNQPPTADAGADQAVTIPNPALLSPSGQPLDVSVELSTSISQAPRWNNSVGQPGLSSPVNEGALSYANGNLYAGTISSASFVEPGTTNDLGVVERWDGTNWSGLFSHVPAFSNGPPFGYMTIPYDDAGGAKLVARGDEVFISGGFLRDLGNDGNNDFTARWDGSAWREWSPQNVGGFVFMGQMFTHLNDVYYAGFFDFQATNGSHAFNDGVGFPGLPIYHDVTRWDGTNWFGVDTNEVGQITAATVGPDNKLYVGGFFYLSTPTGIATNIAVWNGTNWAPMGGGVFFQGVDFYGQPIDDTSVRSIVADDVGNIYVGGRIERAGNVAVRSVARWDGHNWFALGDASQNGVDGIVFSIVPRGHDVYVAGDFVTASGQPARKIARFDGQVWWPVGNGATNGANGVILSLASAPHGIYAAGGFTEVGGMPATNVAYWEFPDEPLRGVVLNGHVSDDGLPNGVLTAHWQQMSGPGTATFANATSAVTTVTFDLPGTYVLRLTADDSELTALDEATISVRANEPPTVNAGPDAAVSISKNLILAGSVSDDGLPDGSTVATVWQQYTGPGVATFENRADPKSSVTFNHTGTYVLKLYANDSQFTVVDSVIVTVLPANAAPSVIAESPFTRPLPFGTVWINSGQTVMPAPIELGGEIADDGLPSGTLVTNWSQVSGPADVLFGDTAAEFTSAVFTEPGDYVLRLTVSDTELSSSSDIPIHVFASDDQPQIPRVWAGNDQHITLPAVAVLNGVIFSTDAVAMTNWQVAAGPGTVTFGDPNAAVTTASFSQPGTYDLQLSVPTIFGQATDDLIVLVDPPSGVNRAPQVAPGAPRTGVINTAVGLDGIVTDDSLPTNGVVTAQWSFISGPGNAVFADPNSPQTTVTCDAVGDYVFELTASDSDLSFSNSTTVHIVACEPDDLPPSVNAGSDEVVDNGFLRLPGSASDDGKPFNQLSYSWDQVSGPSGVEFFSNDQPNSEILLQVPGTYIFRLTASDGMLSDSDDVVITWPMPTNAPSLVDAGPWQTVLLPTNTVTLHGTVPPENFPTGGAVSFHWEVEDAPGEVLFDDTNSLTPVVTFVNPPPIDPGFPVMPIYRFVLVASNADFSSSSEVEIAVGDPAFGQQPITVDAGSAQTVNLGDTVELDGGFDVNADFSEWVQVDGPGGAFIYSTGGGVSSSSVSRPSFESFSSNFSANETHVLFSAPGTYTLRLRALDIFVGSGSADVVITVLPANNPTLNVSAGPTRTLVDAPASLNLEGYITSSESVTSVWEVAGAPDGATVSFSDVQATNSSVTFSMPGDYVLQLTAGNSNLVNSAQVSISVIVPACITNQPPAVNAGADATVTIPTPYTLDGSVSDDDGFPGFGVTQFWSVISGPVSTDNPATGVRFDDPTQLNSRIFFDYPGTYVVRLTGSDGSLTNSDDLVITVLSVTNEAPHVFAGGDQLVNIADGAVQLTGVAFDDGNPVGGSLTTEWSQQTGPGIVTFSDSHATNATVAFTALGTYTLRLTANDSVASGFDDVTITVTKTANGNQPPQVNAGSALATTTFHSITLAGAVADDGLPAGSHVTTLWSEVNGPAPVQFGNALQTNTPVTFLTAGTYTLRLTASDSQSGSSAEVLVTVSDPTNEPPAAFAGPSLTVTRPQPASLDGIVLDDDLPIGSPLTYQWSKVSGPGSVTFVAAGGTNVDATPWLDVDFIDAVASATFGANGTYVLRLSASDTQFTNTDDVTVIALPGTNTPPIVNAGPDEVVSLPNPAILHTEATDDGLENGTLQISWSEVSGPSPVSFSTINNIYQAAFTTTGIYVLRLTAFDGVLSTSDDVTVTVVSTPGPVAELDSPVDGGIVTAPTNIIGTASSAILQSYVIEYRLAPPSADAGPVSAPTNWAVLATGSTSVTSNALAVFDPTMLLNGIYDLRLTATDLSGRSVTTDPITVIVDRNLKMGQFSISFTDLTLPVPGAPVQIIRTYDSRAAAAGIQGDFGMGWTLDMHDVRLQKNRLLSTGWNETATGDPFDLSLAYHLNGGSPRIVTITFPDGRVEKFQFVPNPTDQPLVPIENPQWRFVPLGNTRGTLVPATFDESDGSFLQFSGGIPGDGELYDLNYLFDWFDSTNSVENLQRYPTLFRYTTPEGYKYLIDEDEGLKGLTDPNGNTLTISTNGLQWSNPTVGTNTLQILFQRDEAGRITNIVDAAGNSMSYRYSTNGNLVAFTDRVGQTNGFAYTNINFPHHLTSVIDARGVSPVNSEYDEAGRLVRNTDIYGNAIQYFNDPTNLTSSVVDRNGHSLTQEYDANGNVIRAVDALGGVTTCTYDEMGRRLTRTNPLGQTEQYTYDPANGALIAVVDALGQTNTFDYSAQGQVTRATEKDGTPLFADYDAANNVTRVVDTLGNATVYDHNAAGKVVYSRDALGNEVHAGYDSFGNLTSSTNALGHVSEFAYDDNNRITTQVLSRTNNGVLERLTNSWTYDAAGRVASSVAPDGSTHQTVYDGDGHVAVTIDELGHGTTNSYDLLGRLVQTVYADSTSEGYAYDAADHKVAMTNRLGQVTKYIYDALNRLVIVIMPDGTGTTNFYDAASRMIASSDARGNTTYLGYDALGRTVATTNALGQVTTFGYDARGNQLTSTDALGRTTTNVFDLANRVVATLYPDGTTMSNLFDALGRKVADADQAGRTTLYGYDALGRLISVTNALLQVTRYEYDDLGEQTAQIDASGRVTRYAYDDRGRRVSRILPLGQSDLATYDSLGNMTAYRDFNGNVTAYQYDSLNRLLQKTPDSMLGESSVTFGYNTLGQRTNMVDTSGVTTYRYDERNRLIQKSTPEGTLSYAYDVDGNVTNVLSSNANGVSISYGYDALNRLSAVDDAHLGRTAYAYDAVGNLDGFMYPNWATTTYAYDSLNRLTNATGSKLINTLARYDYTLDASGHRTSVTEAGGRVVNYAYDVLYRLTNETVSGTASAGSLDYAYDAVGNRLARNSSLPGILAGNYSYDANDRLLSDTYDNNGNTRAATMVDPVAGLSTAVSDQYDFENRLVNRNNGQIRVVYDGDGNRVRKVVATATNTITTYYLVDELSPSGSPQVVEELTQDTLHSSLSTPTVTRVYTWGHTLISQDRLNGSTWTESYYGYDGQGSVRYLTDAAGNISDTYDYDAFGNLVGGTGSTPNNYLYQGEQYDQDLKLYYLRARYADPDRGRFWTMDSFEGFGTDPQSLHKYTFNQNDPVNRRDPSGHESLAEESAVEAVGSTADLGLRAFEQSMANCRLQSAAAAAIEGGVIGGTISESITAVISAFTGNAPTADELLKAYSDGFADGSMAGLAIGLSPFTAQVYFGYASAMAGMDFWKDYNNPTVPTWQKYLEAANLVASLMPLLPSVATKMNELLQQFCFPAGTEIAIADGQKPIEEIRPGDLVWSQGDKTGEISLKRVKQVFVNVAASLVVLHCGTNTLEATPEHPLWVVDQGWKAANEVQPGDELWTRSGIRSRVTGIDHKQGRFTVYNFEVEDFHSYFVGESGILVHNKCNIVSRGEAQRELRASLGPDPFGGSGQAHHIFDFVEHQSPLGQKLQNWGVDLNSAENGVWLPNESIPGSPAVPHSGRSTQAYKDEVARRLAQATDKLSAEAILDSVRQDLLSGKLRINAAQ